MDHNLDDSLNLEGAIESMDFDHAGVVINQEDITLESNENVIPIEYEEQQMLMDTGNEEIIVTDFMGDQFTLQEYPVQEKHTLEGGATIKLNPVNVISQSDAVLELQQDSENVAQASGQGVSGQQRFIAVKAGLTKSIKKNETAGIPKQVAIAPKPPKPPKQPQVLEKATFASGKQYSIAPKPVALLVNKNFKKVSLASVQSNVKGNTVWAPLTKKVLMVPAEAAQKIRLVSGSKSVSSSQTAKPVMAKVIVQGGQSGIDVVNPQTAAPTKIIPTINSSASGTHYVMQPKSLPLSFARNKVLLGSPTKEGLRFSKKQIIAIKSPTSKLVPATTQGTATKRVVITTNPTQNIILKTASKMTHISKDVLVQQGQQTQLHQVNVPGKGIQFIRLLSNPSTQAVAKAPPPKPGSWGPVTSHAISLPSKSFVLTDSKGNVIQMTAEKMVTTQPPPLVITGNTVSTTATTERKLVRIAPVTSKSGQAVTQTVRSTQSLLAPISTMTNTKVTIDDNQNANRTESVDSIERPDVEEERYSEVGDEDQGMEEVEQDSKISLHELISNNVMDKQTVEESEVHEDVVYETDQVQDEDNSDDMDKQDDSKEEEHPLIVIPSNFRPSVYSDGQRNNCYTDEDSNMSLLEEQKSFAAMINVETEIASYGSPKTPEAASENDVVTTDLGLRPRKACNCTKSQCLKLYCDCFANGEFCNNCNCNNCHNNLENEELRQRAIRACLERNPYAFRPKIGKSKTGGPDIIRRHNKGCNCKRSGCLKNYCECYEAKIACTAMCKCVGCRNLEETLDRRRELRLKEKLNDSTFRPPVISQVKQPCSFMTTEVIEAVCQCLIAAAAESEGGETGVAETDSPHEEELERGHSPVSDVIHEFARCLQEIIGASHQAMPQPGEEQAC